MSMISRTIFYFLWYLHTLLESLPISSSGHMQLFLRRRSNNVHSALPEYLDHAMHITTAFVLLAFLVSAWLVMGFPACVVMQSQLESVVVANAITVLFYLLLRNVKEFFPLSLGFLVTTLALFSLTIAPLGNQCHLLLSSSLLLGLAQACSLLPGVSRLGTTYVAGCWLGLDPCMALLTSCLLQFPLVLVAVAQSLYLIFCKHYPFYVVTWHNVFLLVASSFGAFLLLWILMIAGKQLIALFGFYTLFVSFVALFS